MKPKASDFKLTPKILKKECFGSAGCNVEFRIGLAYSGPDLDPSKTYEVSYSVTGGEDPLQGTIQVTEGGQYEVQEELVSTKSKASKIRVKVTGLEELGF